MLQIVKVAVTDTREHLHFSKLRLRAFKSLVVTKDVICPDKFVIHANEEDNRNSNKFVVVGIRRRICLTIHFNIHLFAVVKSLKLLRFVELEHVFRNGHAKTKFKKTSDDLSALYKTVATARTAHYER